MGCCTGRCLLITICVLQLLSTVERQVFDFLGYMWTPIIGNFLQIIFIIIGFFGALQYRPKVLIAYTVWCVIWLGWNVFVICMYLEVGFLSRDSNILNLGTGNKSWWLDHGLGCQVNTSWSASSPSSAALETHRDVPPEAMVQGCLLQYYYVEVVHAGVQCLLALLGFCVSCYVIYVFTEEDDSSQPVHDELEYIKMRYRSPARSSFRDNKTYETLTTRSTYTTSSSLDRGLENQQYSDDSGEHTPRDSSQQRLHKPKKYIPHTQLPDNQLSSPSSPWDSGHPSPTPSSRNTPPLTSIPEQTVLPEEDPPHYQPLKHSHDHSQPLQPPSELGPPTSHPQIPQYYQHFGSPNSGSYNHGDGHHGNQRPGMGNHPFRLDLSSASQGSTVI